LETVKVPKSVVFNSDHLLVDGVRIRWDIIPQLLFELAHPDFRKWYRLERVGDDIIIHVKISEEEPNGNAIADTGGSEEGAGGTRQETPLP
jgi:hypothetical protein